MQTNNPPNLMFVFADQLGYTRCGYAGDEKARTPNIDRLASQGVNFCNAVSNTPGMRCLSGVALHREVYHSIFHSSTLFRVFLP